MDTLTDPRANAEISAFMAGKIRARVKDPKVAEMLIPKDHGFGLKRVPMESGYYEAYNQPNVHLVDTNGQGVRQVTAAGPVVDGTPSIRISLLICRPPLIENVVS